VIAPCSRTCKVTPGDVRQFAIDDEDQGIDSIWILLDESIPLSENSLDLGGQRLLVNLRDNLLGPPTGPGMNVPGSVQVRKGKNKV